MVTMLFVSLVLFLTCLVSYPVISIYRIVHRSRKSEATRSEYYRRIAKSSGTKVYHIG